MRSSSNPSRAEAVFKKEERARQGQIAMNQYLEDQEATRAKTARLRALRLALAAEQSARPEPAAENPARQTTRRTRRGLQGGSRTASR